MTPAKRARPRAAIVYHPARVDLERLRAVVAAMEESRGWLASSWHATSVDDPAAGIGRELVDSAPDVVIAAGGDGTVRAVAEVLRNTGVPLAIVPSGTGNLLARNLGVSVTRLDHAMRTAFDGEGRTIDVGVLEVERPDGRIGEFVFTVLAGVGLDAHMVARTNPDLKRRVGWLAYLEGIARGLRDSAKIRVRYSVDGSAPRSLSAHTVLVGNCGVLPGNVVLLPEAAVDDGLFDIVALRPEGFGGWLRIWIGIFWENGVLRRSQVGRRLMGRSRPVRAMRYLKARGFDARLDPPQEFELDGDGLGIAVAFRARVDPGALVVRVPRSRR